MNCCCLLLGACVGQALCGTSNMLNHVASFVVLVVVVADALCLLCLRSSRGLRSSSWRRFRIFENCYQQTGEHSHLCVYVCVYWLGSCRCRFCCCHCFWQIASSTSVGGCCTLRAVLFRFVLLLLLLRLFPFASFRPFRAYIEHAKCVSQSRGRR